MADAPGTRPCAIPNVAGCHHTYGSTKGEGRRAAMTIRNLDAVFRPRSVALIGASERPGSIGRVLLENLAAFPGSVFPVNQRHWQVLGHRAYAGVALLPEVPDLAIIATPAASVPELVGALAERGVRGAVIVSAGLGASTDAGRALRAVLGAHRGRLLRVVGPNTLGVAAPAAALNASFAHLTPSKGRLAFVTQSGAIATSVLDWATARDIGFSHLVALGDMLDVDFGDMLDYLANDADTSAILLYMEAVTAPRKFMSAARAAARTKPVIVVKGGRHAASASAAASHTGRLASSDAEYTAAFRRAGMLRVASLDQLFDAVETLAVGRVPRGPRLAIVTNGGGLGVLAVDELVERGGELAVLGDETLRRLDDVLPANWSRGNPIDIVGDAPPERFRAALEVVLGDPECGGVLVLHCPTAVSSGLGAARVVAELARTGRSKAALYTSWIGERTAREARAELTAARVPTFDTPERAVRAFVHSADYRRNQELLKQAPPSTPDFATDRAAVAEAFAQADAAGREWLAAGEMRAVLAGYGIATVGTVTAATPAEAAEAAARIGGAVALKIASPDVVHKSDVGGVALDLVGRDIVMRGAELMLKRVRAAEPDARLEGFTVEPMVPQTATLELIVGASSGGDFGPMLLFGDGGTDVEVVADTTLELPPLDLALARRMVERTRVYRKMLGFRHVPAVAMDAVLLSLMRVSQLIMDWPRIGEMEINPLLASPAGCIALDARLRLAAAAEAPASRLAICPYPRELERPLADSGQGLLLRPIRPSDEPMLRRAFGSLRTPEARSRVLAPLLEMPLSAAARLTQIDYDRELVLVAIAESRGAAPDLRAVARLVADPEHARAEFGILLRPEGEKAALATELLRAMLDYARQRGIGELHGYFHESDTELRAACRSLGFVEQNGEGVVRISAVLHR